MAFAFPPVHLPLTSYDVFVLCDIDIMAHNHACPLAPSNVRFGLYRGHC